MPYTPPLPPSLVSYWFLVFFWDEAFEQDKVEEKNKVWISWCPKATIRIPHENNNGDQRKSTKKLF